jgi:hypothetical protein
MQTIYIVEGTTGEYSDTVVWQIKAFSEEEAAKNFTESINNLAKSLKIHEECAYDCLLRPTEEQLNELRKLDPCVNVYYNGVVYNYFELELV